MTCYTESMETTSSSYINTTMACELVKGDKIRMLGNRMEIESVTMLGPNHVVLWFTDGRNTRVRAERWFVKLGGAR